MRIAPGAGSTLWAVSTEVLPAGLEPGPPLLDVVVPVYNEERDLEPSIRRLSAYLEHRFPFSARITIADNASTDGTWAIALRLERRLSCVRAIRIPAKGRGRALAAAWLASDATVLAYMDVDLSTDLDGLLPLVAPIISGHSDVAIGSRLAPGARVVRGGRRELISRAYNLLLRVALRVRFRDAQCGFKAVRADVARRLLPIVESQAWFFDTELLVLAERAGLRIHEVPVDWVDDTDSRVDILATAWEDLRGIMRVSRRLASGRFVEGLEDLRRPGKLPPPSRELPRFALVGVASTAAYAALFWLLRAPAGPFAANAIALVLTTLGNTALNRRFTFGARPGAGAGRHHVAGLAAMAVAVGMTSAALWALHAILPGVHPLIELGVLVAAGAAGTLVRFVLLRAAIHSRRAPAAVIELRRSGT